VITNAAARMKRWSRTRATASPLRWSETIAGKAMLNSPPPCKADSGRNELAGSCADFDGGFLRTAIMERGGRGKNLSITRTRGVRKFSILICHKPKVFLCNKRPFNHHAGEPKRLNDRRVST
jgi:hypothetical protein